MTKGCDEFERLASEFGGINEDMHKKYYTNCCTDEECCEGYECGQDCCTIIRSDRGHDCNCAVPVKEWSDEDSKKWNDAFEAQEYHLQICKECEERGG